MLVLITVIPALGTFIFAILQYRNAQTWKRNEFLADQINKFYYDQYVIDVEGMLDYTSRSFQDEEGDSKITITVYHSQEDIPKNSIETHSVNLGTALHYHLDGPPQLEELKIRERIDTYFYYIQRFAIFIQNGLFTKRELYPYLEYHISLLNGLRDHSAGYHEALYNYLTLYDFDQAVKFLGQFKRAKFVEEYIDRARKRKAQLATLPVGEERAAEYRRRLYRPANSENV
jgi:hypothetical protein